MKRKRLLLAWHSIASFDLGFLAFIIAWLLDKRLLPYEGIFAKPKTCMTQRPYTQANPTYVIFRLGTQFSRGYYSCDAWMFSWGRLFWYRFVSKQKEHVNPMLWGYLPWYFQVMSEKQRSFGPRYILIYFETVIGVQVPPAQTIKSEWTAEKWEAKHDEYKAKERPNTTQPSNPMVKSVDRHFLPR